MKFLLTIAALFITTLCFSQKQNVYFLKNNGMYVETRDSADYIRIISEPDSASTLYNVSEFYIGGKQRLIGKSITVDPPRYEGKCLSYFPNGLKMSIANFTNGARSGLQYRFFPNGKPYLVEEFAVDGQPDNRFRDYQIKACYDSLGTTLAENGNGYVKIYDDDFKAIFEEGAIKDGKHEGNWKGYESKRKVTFFENYSDGKLVSGTAKYDDGSTSTYSNSRGTQPEFKGGIPSFGQYLSANIRYPNDERRSGIEGRVILTFIVEKDGSVSDVRVSKSASPGLDEEALRVIKKSAHWIPGTLYGKPVRVAYSVPVSFKLEK